MNRALRGLSVLSIVTALLMGCAATAEKSTAIAELIPEPSPAYGDYLAARLAGSLRDTASATDYYLRAVKADPSDSRLLRRAFALSVQDSRFEEALPLAARLAEQSSTATIAKLLILLDDLRSQDYEAARAKLDATPSSGINALFGPVIRAWTLAGEGQTDLAIDALTPLSAENSFRAFREYHRALIFDVAGRDNNAEAAYASALDGQQGSIRVVLAYGRLLERIGRASDATLLYRKYIDRFADNPLLTHAIERAASGEVPARLISGPAEGVAEALFGTAHALARESARPAATVYLRLATFLRPDMPDAYLLLGSLLRQVGQNENALREYQKIPDQSPLAWGVRLETAVLVNRLDRGEEAISLLKDMIGQRPDDLQAIVTLADVYRDQERYEEAGVQYDHAIEVLPEIENRHWVLFYSRGIAMERTKRWDSAEADFLKALELEPEQPLVLNYLGYTWVDMGKNIEEARGMIERAVELRPNDGYIVDSLGWAMFRLGDFDDAVDTLERAVLLRPDDPTINDHLGDAYWQVGRLREARFQWAHALVLDPDETLIETIEAKLEDGPQTAENDRP